MQVKATAPTSVSVLVDPAEFESTGPVVVHVAPVLSLSLDDLVMALMLGAATTEAVAAMDDDAIRAEVAFTLAVSGMGAVHEAVQHDRQPGLRRSAGERAHVELCRSRVAAAFGVKVAPATRSRAASRSIGARQTLTTVAA
jgi:hypothetical protein